MGGNIKMKYGDYVSVKGISTFEYNSIGEKEHHIGDCIESRKGIILRKTRRATGYYNEGYIDQSNLFLPEIPPHLEVDKWHTVYEVALSPRGIKVFVTEDNMELIRSLFGHTDD